MAEDIHPHPNDDDEDVCRVCRAGEDDGTLIYPCKCSGSVRYVHQDCLKQWVETTDKKQCEICGHKYTFSKVYPDTFPEHIPPIVYVRQGVFWIGRQLHILLRAWLAVIAWLVVLPAVSMFALRSLMCFTDYIGIPGPEALERVASNGTDVDVGGERRMGDLVVVTGMSTVDFLVGPLPAIYRLARRSIKNWMQGDSDTAVGFVLRGQTFSLSLAAVIIGLILLREWITQHNWNEEINPARPPEEDIVPDDWMIVNGHAIRFSDRIAVLLEEARAVQPLLLEEAGAVQPPADPNRTGASDSDLWAFSDDGPEGTALLRLFFEQGRDFSRAEWLLFLETTRHLAAQGNRIAVSLINLADRSGCDPCDKPQEDAFASQAEYLEALREYDDGYKMRMRRFRMVMTAGVAEAKRWAARKAREQRDAAQQVQAGQGEDGREGHEGREVDGGVADAGGPDADALEVPAAPFTPPFDHFILAPPGDDPLPAANDANSNNTGRHSIPQTLPDGRPFNHDADDLDVILHRQALLGMLTDPAETGSGTTVGDVPEDLLSDRMLNGGPLGWNTDDPAVIRELRGDDTGVVLGRDDPTDYQPQEPVDDERFERIEINGRVRVYPRDVNELLPPWRREPPWEPEDVAAGRGGGGGEVMDELARYRAMHVMREQAGTDPNGAGPSNRGGAGVAQPERPGRNGYGSPPQDVAYVAPEMLADAAGEGGYNRRGAPGNARDDDFGRQEGYGDGERKGEVEDEDDYQLPAARRTLPLYPEPVGWGAERENDGRRPVTDPGLPAGPHVQNYPMMPPNMVGGPTPPLTPPPPEEDWEDEVNHDGDGDGDGEGFIEHMEGGVRLPRVGGGAMRVPPEDVPPELGEVAADGRIMAVDFVDDGGELDEEDVWDPEDWQGILEVLGLTGTLHGLFQNVLFGCMVMVASTAILVGIPMILGKIFLSVDYIRTALMIGLRTLRLIKKITGPVVDVIWEIIKDVLLAPAGASFRALERIVLKKLGMSVWDVDHFGGFGGLGTVNKASSGGFALPAPLATLLARIPPSLQPDELLAALGQHTLDSYDRFIETNHAMATSGTLGGRAGCVLAGYATLLGTVLLIALGGEAGLGSAAETLAGVVKQNGTFIKVAFFMVLELAVFPLGVGFMIDFCTIPLFPNATVLGRLEHLASAPFGTVFVNWLQGTMFMFFFANILGHVRELCRPGTMFFIRDPADPNFSPVKDIMDKSTLHQMRKLGTSAVMYGVVIFMLFGAASWGLAYQPFWDVLPLKMEPAFGPLTSVPFDYLFLHLVVPPTFEMVLPRQRSRLLFTALWRFAIDKLRLASLMEPDVDSDEVVAAAEPAGSAEIFFWKSADRICQFLFGKYNPRSTNMRVPANDSVVLVPMPERSAQGGVFIPLTPDGVPRTAADKLRLLKQDKLAREAGRVPEHDYTMVRVPEWWRTRIHVLIECCLLVASGVMAAGVMGPVLVGRMLWRFIGVEVHDGYAWFVGAYVLYGSLYLGRRAKKYISSIDRPSRLRSSVASRRAKRSVRKFAAGVYGVGMVYGLLPLLVGVVVEIYMGVVRGESHGEGVRVIHVWDVWANGLAICSLAVALSSVLHRAHLLWLEPIRTCFREPTTQGFRGTTDATLQPILALSLLIVAPYMVGLVAAFSAGSQVEDEGLTTWQFNNLVIPMCFATAVFILCRRSFAGKLAAIRQSMVDAEYVLEERVENYVAPEERRGKPGSGHDHGVGVGEGGVGGEVYGEGGEDGEEWEDM